MINLPQHSFRMSKSLTLASNQAVPDFLRRRMVRSICLQALIVALVLVFTGLFSASSVGQDVPGGSGSKEQSDNEAPISVEVTEVDSMLIQGADRNTTALRISIRLKVTNTSSDSLVIDRSQFELSHLRKKFDDGSYESNPALSTQQVKPRQSVEGFIWFVGIPHSEGEVPLELKWYARDVGEVKERNLRPESSGDDGPAGSPEDGAPGTKPEPRVEKSRRDASEPELVLALTPVLRKLNRLDVEALGPDDCLTQIRVHRTQDAIATWYMAELLSKLSKEGRQRILITTVPEDRTMGPRVTVMDEYITWLAALVETPERQLAVTSPLKPLDVQFKSISLAGIPQAPNRRFYGGRRALQMFDSVDDAIFESLAPVYRFVNVQDAISDLSSPVSGVRRAAVAGIADRVSADEADRLLKMAQSENEQVQLQMVPYLNLLPGGKAIGVLRELALSENTKVSTEAIQSLCACPDDAAVVAMADLWQASAQRSELRSSILAAIVRQPDERWVPLAKDYVEGFLKTATDKDVPEIRPTSISGALGLLRDLERVQMANVIAAKIGDIQNSELQDVLLEYEMTVDFPSRAAVVHNVLDQRIAAKKISPSILRAVTLFPDAKWTLALLELGRQKEKVKGYGDTLRPALSCANETQLELILRGFVGCRRISNWKFSFMHLESIIQDGKNWRAP